MTTFAFVTRAVTAILPLTRTKGSLNFTSDSLGHHLDRATGVHVLRDSATWPG